MLIKNKCSAHKCISIYFTYVVCVLYNNVFLSYSYETCHISKQFENSWFHIFEPIISLLFYRINVLWLYYRITSHCKVIPIYMSLTIVLRSYIFHIIYNYCPIFYFVNYYVYSILIITVAHYSKFFSSYFVNQG